MGGADPYRDARARRGERGAVDYRPAALLRRNSAARAAASGTAPRRAATPVHRASSEPASQASECGDSRRQ